VFESGNPENLAACLTWAIANPERLKEIGAQGRAVMLSEYSWDKIGRQTADCYVKALSA
jgi:glycosyltransferase involved in cell wall biosynthesis